MPLACIPLGDKDNILYIANQSTQDLIFFFFSEAYIYIYIITITMWNQTCNPWMIHPMQQLATPMHITHKDYIRLKTISIYYKVQLSNFNLFSGLKVQLINYT